MTIVTAENTAKSVAKAIAVTNVANEAGSISEDMLARRMAKVQAEQEIIYEFTNDIALLHQYYNLREDAFINVWKLNNYSGAEDDFDRKSLILVARQGKQVVGGCRLTLSTPSNPQTMPMEKEDFVLNKVLPELDLTKRTYCECSRLAILPDFRAGKVFPTLQAHFIRRALAEGSEYAFTMAPLPLARNYRQSANAFQLQWDIRRDVAIPDREEFEGIKMVLSIMKRATVKTAPESKSSEPLRKTKELVAD